ncbi:MAG: cation acetate symporter [Verrucomicrobiota bacterium]|jgi:cation/acetate symporter|nr:cation acetate symporter [Verrucomicrobiota bacterium]
MFSSLLAAVDPWIVSLSALTVLVTVGMGFWAAGRAKSASDFFVAGRGVSVGWNASAISGEYLSAASFMGVAGMVMSSGYDALWYPVCYACGYLFLLLFIAGPLRRFGAYTIPDFAEGRYDSPLFRKIAVVFVLFIGFFYTMPQMKGAGTTLAYVFQEVDFRGTFLEFLAPHGADGSVLKGFPYWAGVVVVGAVITLNVALGGMKGITLVQAFQYWAKMFAISVPVFVLMAVQGHYGQHLQANQLQSLPAQSVSAQSVSTDTRESTEMAVALKRAPLSAKAPTDSTWLNPFGPLTSKSAKAAKLGAEESKPYALLYTYSLIIALVCGTAGLPHILVRFYTNPDGAAAKRTTMWVMILIGIFYVFPPVFGVMGRNLLPALYEGTGAKGTDKIVLELPKVLDAAIGNSGSIPWGSILSGMTCAGAFAAFMSTFSGLLVSMTGALAHDVYGRILRPESTAQERMQMFKWCAVLLGAVSTLLGCFVEQLQINFMVGQAFAIAAASYFPLLFMSVWWRGMTMKGAATGMLTGGVCALLTVALTNFSDLKWLPLGDFWAAHPLLRILCEQPAIWCVPLAIGLMVVVSKATAATVPADIRMKMLVLHAPEALGLRQEYIRDQEGH